MKRSTLILLLSLLAALGIAGGLALHVGQKWRDDRQMTRNHSSFPGRFPPAQFVDGTCGEGVLQLNEERLATHLTSLGGDLNLTGDQVDLIGQLVLGRVQVGCDLRADRLAIRQAARQNPLSDPETARPFMQSLLAFRQALTEETLKETRIQRQLLASFTDEQLAAIDVRTLPQLVPGLSLREFMGQTGPSSGGRGGKGGNR